MHIMNVNICIQKLQIHDMCFLLFKQSVAVAPHDAWSPQMIFSSLIKYNRLMLSYRAQVSFFSPHITDKFTIYKFKNKDLRIKLIIYSFRLVAPHDIKMWRIHCSSFKEDLFVKMRVTTHLLVVSVGPSPWGWLMQHPLWDDYQNISPLFVFSWWSPQMIFQIMNIFGQDLFVYYDWNVCTNVS